MAERTYEVKVNTSVDDSAIQGLEEYINQLNGADFKVTADSSEVEALEEEIELIKEQIEIEEQYGFDTTESEQKLAELQARLEEVQSEAESGAEVVFNTDSAQAGVDGLMGSIDGLSQLAVGEKLQEWGTAGESFAQDLNNANIVVGQLSTNTGMAEEQMRGLIANISNATFPQEEAMAYVQALNQMGVSVNQLGDSATNMDRLNDATGIGYQKVMQLTQGLQSVGISADNLPASFNAIAYAQANVTGGADTLSTVLKRQAATIEEYGLNVDQLVLIMQNLSEKGVQGMKMGSELGKVLKDNNGDIQAIEQSLGMEAGALSNASEKTGQYKGKIQELADEEAEHKTILEQISAFVEDVTLKHGELFSMLGSVGGGFGQLIGFGNSLNGTLNLLGGTGGLPGVAEKLGLMGGEAAGASGMMGTLGSGLASLASGPVLIIIAAIAGIIIALEQFGEAMGWWNDFGGMFEAIADGARRMWEAFTQNEHVIEIVDKLKAAFEGLKEWINGLMTDIAKAFGWIDEGGESFDFVASAIETLGAVGDAVLPLLSAYIDMCIPYWQMLGQVISWVVLNLIVPYLQFMWVFWSAVFSAIQAVASAVWNGIVAIITTAINIIRGIINGARAIWSGLTSAWNTLRSVGQSVFNAISSAVNSAGNAWNNFKNTVMSVVNAAISKINELKSAAEGIGSAIGLGGEEFSYTTALNGNAGTGARTINNIFNINVGSVDSTERVNEVRDALEQVLDNEIAKQNLTIG